MTGQWGGCLGGWIKATASVVCWRLSIECHCKLLWTWQPDPQTRKTSKMGVENIVLKMEWSEIVIWF